MATAVDKKRMPMRATDGMTLMVIPHSQRHVVKVRLNFRLIYFSLALLLTAVALAVLSFTTLPDFTIEKELVMGEARAWQNKINLFQSAQEKIIDKITFFERHGKTFYQSIWADNSIDVPEARSDDHFLSEYMQGATTQLKHALEFLTVREEAFQDLPIGWPIKSGFISSIYGGRSNAFGLFSEFHYGYDFASSSGSKIHATADGVVLSAGGGEGGLGLKVRLLHNHGFVTVYGHCSKLIARKDQRVKRGQVIALLGRTGNATGPHVHYEVKLRDPVPGRRFEIHLNPWPFARESL